MRQIVLLFVGGFLGLIIGLSLPPLSITKVQKLNILFLMYAWEGVYLFGLMLVNLIMEVTLMVLNYLQLNLPYGFLHFSCVQEKYIDSSTSSQDQFQSDPTKVCEVIQES